MIRLHGYWRSSAAYRVRIALNLKGISYAQVSHDLRTGAQHSAEYRAIAPQGLVPALETDGGILTQSPAILEWIDERWPAPPLLPADALGRAHVRAMAALIGCDIHPLNNLRVLRHLRAEFGATQAQVDGWIGRWIAEGFAALETLVGRHDGAFCHGDDPGLADCYLVPQLYSAERFGVDLEPFPTLRRVGQAMARIEAVARAHPSRQPDADPA
ncbi:maleylpyruvate isomerase [Sphingobium fontiphilum]|uniref:Maleylpyruvate isomerase n=1 Tax=Sphingobium fontiphilum TaxID=944425 RepID=A0A7W6DKW3_9SPHN|nr:maleylacetoacetate isomerase [Sphingobium fontiphilum]MBB3981718.1 maleylpyruvate isomerase [Sphingobium fontiphilum]